MLRAMKHSGRVDDERWTMDYPEHLIGWLVDLLPLEFQWTPMDILNLEHRFPGIVNDIDTELWQRKLMRDEYESRNKKTHNG